MGQNYVYVIVIMRPTVYFSGLCTRSSLVSRKKRAPPGIKHMKFGTFRVCRTLSLYLCVPGMPYVASAYVCLTHSPFGIMSHVYDICHIYSHMSLCHTNRYNTLYLYLVLVPQNRVYTNDLESVWILRKKYSSIVVEVLRSLHLSLFSLE